MKRLPDTLDELLRIAGVNIREILPDGTDDELKDMTRLLEWLEEAWRLKHDVGAALDNAVEALRRTVDRLELRGDSTPNDVHHANRLNKLIHNLLEVVDLERKKES